MAAKNGSKPKLAAVSPRRTDIPCNPDSLQEQNTLIGNDCEETMQACADVLASPGTMAPEAPGKLRKAPRFR